jgi:hypothetical protein
MSGRADVASFVGFDRAGGPIFDVVVTVPDGVVGDARCTERQLAAVREFYCHEFPDDLTYSQAHLLLSYREYARSCSAHLLRGAHPKIVLLYARAIAAFISSNEPIANYAATRSNVRFRSGVERERISRTKFFPEISLFFETIFVESYP